MEVLEELGFIKVRRRGPRRYGYVLLVHPSLAVKRLYDQGRVPDDWWEVYISRQMEVGETKGTDIIARIEAAKQEKKS